MIDISDRRRHPRHHNLPRGRPVKASMTTAIMMGMVMAGISRITEWEPATTVRTGIARRTTTFGKQDDHQKNGYKDDDD